MSRTASRLAPTPLSTAVFGAKVVVFRLRRSLAEAGRAPRRLRRAPDAVAFAHPVTESVTELWSDPALAERSFQLGKVHNLRRAAMALDGLLIPAGGLFSFWRQVGQATRARGYVQGRMLREGCMVAAVGGGLCQLSNALYDVAERAGCRIVERHPHSRVVPGSAAAVGRDATVAWNYVDLRFAAPCDLLLKVKLGPRHLSVALFGRAAAPERSVQSDVTVAQSPLSEAQSCGLCDETDCFLHEHGRRAPPARSTRTGFLLDEAWPEFVTHVASERRPTDVLGVPSRYRWPGSLDGDVFQAPVAAARRSLAWRTTPAQGPARRKADAQATAAIARGIAAQLGPDVIDVCVAQSFLPTLWREGWLGGRGFSVLMTRLPMGVLQTRLDAAFTAHPERATLADHRAPGWLCDAEAEALAAAGQIITPHAEIAALFPGRSRLLPWRIPPPPAMPPQRGDAIVFPGPTVARKGAFEVRAAAMRLDRPVRSLGSELEGPMFWRGVALDQSFDATTWLDGAAAVVQPALAEAAPRSLLSALAAGVPVIATQACGLPAQSGLELIPWGDAEALVAAIEAVARRPVVHPEPCR